MADLWRFTPTLVTGQVVTNSVGAASGTGAMPGNVTNGNILLVAVAWSNNNSNTPTVTKSSGTATIGTISKLSTTLNTQNQALGNGTAVNAALWGGSVTGSGSLTLQVAQTSGTGIGFVAMEWSGLTTTLDGSQAANVTGINTGTTGPWTITANTVMTSQSNSLICGWSTDDGGSSPNNFSSTPGTGYTSQGTGSPTGDPVFFVYQVANAGSYTPNYSLSYGAALDIHWRAGIGALALAASGVVMPPRPIIINQAAQRAAVR